MTSTYKTGETPAVGDVVRIGNGDATWRVERLYPSDRPRQDDKAALRRVRDKAPGAIRNATHWMSWDRLVLITPASDAERAEVARKLAEVEAEGERIQEHRAAHRRVAAFVDQHADTPSYSDKILSLGRMVDGEVADFTLTISDLRTLLAGLDR